MSLKILQKLYDNIERKENIVQYKYEPWKKKPEKIECTRHYHFNEIQSDFQKEITSYGFSPYIHQTCEAQQQNKEIMKYHHKIIHSGLLNYVKKRYVLKQSGKCQKNIRSIPIITSETKQQDGFLFKAFQAIRGKKDPLKANLFIKDNKRPYNEDDEKNESNSSFSSNPLLPQFSDYDTNILKGRDGLMRSKSDVLITRPQTTRLNLYPNTNHNINDLKKLIKKEEENTNTPSTMSRINKLLLELNDNLPKSKDDWKRILLPKPISSKEFIKRLSLQTYSHSLHTHRSNNINDLLTRNMFISKSQYLDHIRLIAEKYPGSLFDKMRLIRKNNPFKPKIKLPNKIRRIRKNPLEVV